MKIYGINVTQQKSNFALQQRNLNKVEKASNTKIKNDTITFKGDEGALVGMGVGALAGFGLAALTIATGGLAGLVAAAGGATGILGGATGLGANIGGIIGGFAEEYGNDDDNKRQP